MLAEVGSRLKPEWSHSCRNTSPRGVSNPEKSCQRGGSVVGHISSPGLCRVVLTIRGSSRPQTSDVQSDKDASEWTQEHLYNPGGYNT
jgi:hypothetical protein